MISDMKLAVSSFILVLALVAGSSLSYGTPAYAKKEAGAKCTVCHVTMGKKELNAVGKCYAENKHSLATCGTKK